MRTTLLSSLIPLSLLSACGSQVIAIDGQSDDGLALHAAAVTLVQERGAVLGLDHNDSVRQRTAFVDELGQEHVRFDRSYRGLPVIGGRADVRVNMVGRAPMIGSCAFPIPAGFVTVPAFDGEAATVIAWTLLGQVPTGVQQPAPMRAPISMRSSTGFSRSRRGKGAGSLEARHPAWSTAARLLVAR